MRRWMRTIKTRVDSLNKNSLTSCMMRAAPLTQVHWCVLLFNKTDYVVLDRMNWESIFLHLSRLSGEVLASSIVQYLHTMTAQSSEQDRLAALRRLLDPECQDPHVSRETFHSTMREWIAQCSQDR